MARAQKQSTFEAMKPWLQGESLKKLRPLTGAEIDELRPRVAKAYADYQADAKHRSGDDLVDALVQVAGLRSDEGPGKPFAQALDEVLDELRDAEEPITAAAGDKREVESRRAPERSPAKHR